jgi:GT2 family glycosyltransferase
MSAAPDLSFVVITYNDAARLPRCLASAALMSARAGLGYEIFVVDNASVDHTAQVLAEFAGVLGPRLKVIRLAVNRGTTYSRNRALEQAAGRMVCVMDSDAELLDHDFARVWDLFAAFPEVGIVGPTIILPDGHIYDSAKRLPTLGDKLLKLPQIFLGAPPVNHDWYPDFPFATVRCVETAISCCWFFRRELFGRVGPLDERIFYAPEDVDWCLRSWKAGQAVVYYPRFRVLHHTRHTTHKHPLSPTALSHLKGLLYYLNKHRYWFSREALVRRHVEPLARSLDPRLAAWDAQA